MDIIIRKAQPEDAAAIIAYMNTIGGETDNLTFGSEGFPISPEEEAEIIEEKNESPRNALFLAIKGERIIGSASIETYSRRMAHRAEFGISVLKAEWDRGIGSRLLETILQHAKSHQVEIIELEVRSDNARAIHLYEKYGFVKIGAYPKYFKLKEDSYVDFDLMNLYL